MRTAIFTEPGKPLVIETVADPTPGPGEIVMKVHSCGICGSDLHMTEDHGPAFTLPPGGTPGHELAGEVAAVGRSVSGYLVGDRISALPFTGCGRCRCCLAGAPAHCPDWRPLGNGFAEYTLVSAFTTVKLDADLDFDTAALVEPMAVGLHGAAIAPVRPGDKVLVMGAGPIGLAAAWFAQRLGAAQVVVSATSRRREAFARAIGIDHFLLPEEGQSLENAAREVMGEPPDIILECAGQPGCVDEAINTVRRAGTVVILGFCTDPEPIIPAVTMWKEVAIKGSNTYTIGEFRHVADLLAGNAPELPSMITGRVSLDKLPAMFESLRGPNEHCKVLVKPWEA